MLIVTSLGVAHSAIRRGEHGDPGWMATNFGALTPLVSLVGHVLYGVLLGLLYAALPLA